MNTAERLAQSDLVQLVINLILYSLYATLLGLSAAPSLWLMSMVGRPVIAALAMGSMPSLPEILAAAIGLGVSAYLFFAASVFVMGSAIRLLSLGIKAGTYPAHSFVTLRWLIFSGVYNLMTQLVLPVIPMSYFSLAFWRILGAKVGKNARINSWMLNDPYLLEIGDNAVIGGQADVSCHLFQNGKLILGEIKIGARSVIGAHTYISPGTTIGEDCVIGLGAYLRPGTTVPDGTIVTSVGSAPPRTARKIERGKI
jgi:hypothetical protein